jgi:hypothetical protein
LGEDDLAPASQIHSGEGAGKFEVGEGFFVKDISQPFDGASQTQQGGFLVSSVTVQAGLVKSGEHVFDLCDRVAGGVENCDNATETGASHGFDVEAFLFETPDDAEVGIAFCAAAAECESEVHGLSSNTKVV